MLRRIIPLDNGWTGGQYSVFRALFGAYLLVHFAHLVPWGPELFSSSGVLPDAAASPLAYLFPNVLTWFDAPGMVTGFLILGVVASGFFAFGWFDRIAALVLWYLWACMIGRNPLIMNPSLAYVGWMLVAHACLPRGPYGSWGARGRVDPGGGWRMPPEVYAIAWLLLAAGYSYSGLAKLVSPSWVDGSALSKVLSNPLARPSWLRDLLLALPAPVLTVQTYLALAIEILFLPLIFVPRLRPLLWGLLLFMHLGLITVISLADLSMGMVMVHLFTFDPGWVRARDPGTVEIIFYDGHCGLCHRLVRFILAEDPQGKAFAFAALDSAALRAALTEVQRQALPDSVVLLTADGRVLTRSAAVLHLFARLGGVWRVLSSVGRLVPAVVRDWTYDRIAGMRQHLFAKPAEVCPLMPPGLRGRFKG